MSTDVQKLAGLLDDALRRIKTLETQGVGLGYSSFDRGGITQYQPGSDIPGAKFGQQYDGTNGTVVYSGPRPGQPVKPEATSKANAIIVNWGGKWSESDFAVAPLDFARMEVYRSQTAPTADTFYLFENFSGQTIETARGGEVSIYGVAPGESYYVWLVARTSSGAYGTPSEVVGPVTVVGLTVEDINLEDFGGNEIFAGPNTPTGAQKIGNLWLKEVSAGQFETRRWDGDSWELVPDQRVTQALQDAFDAQETANQAGVTASDAATLAGLAKDQAQSASDLAAGANTLAGQAKTAADSKITVYRQATAPSGGTYKVNGDLWIDSDDGLVYYASTTSGAWLATPDQRIAAVITTTNSKTTVFAQISAPSTTSRTVGDIWIDTDDGNTIYDWPTAGGWTKRQLGATAISATARQLGAITTYRQASAPTLGMLVGDFWIDSDDNQIYRFEGATPTWVASRDTAINTAISNAATAQAVADGKMRIFTQASPPGPMLNTDVGDLWIDTADNNLSYTWELIGTGSYGWVKRQISTSSIKPNSLVASDVIATGTVSAGLLEATLVLATTIIAGNASGAHVRINAQGLRVFRGDVNGDGTPDESVRLGVAGAADRLAVVKADGSLAFVTDETGYVTASGLSLSGTMRVGAADYTGRGGSLYEILDRRPRGIVARGLDLGTYDFNTVAGRGVFDVSARLYDNRLYKICVRGRINGAVANDALAEIQVRYEYGTDGVQPASPNINSQVAGRMQISTARPEAQGFYFEKPFSWGFGTHYRDTRFLLCVARPVGSTTLTLYGPQPDGIEMWIEDIGPYVETAQTANNGGGSVSTPGPPPAPQQTRYNRTWVCNWRQNWQGSGAFVNLADVYQGLDPSGNNGNQRSYLGFSGAATDGSGWGMDIVNGARIEEIGIYLYYPHWYNYAGGDAVIGFHGYRDPAASFGGGNEWMIGVPGWRRNEGRWISVGQTLGTAALQNFANGTWKGIMLGSANAGDLAHYGRAQAESSAQINITYWK